MSKEKSTNGRNVRVSNTAHEEASEFCKDNGRILFDFVNQAISEKLERERRHIATYNESPVNQRQRKK